VSYPFPKEHGSSVKIQFDKTNAGFMIRAPHFDTSPYKSVQISIYNPEAKDKNNIFIELAGPDSKVLGNQLLSWYAEGKVFKAKSWYNLSIPLANLGAVGTQLNTITLVSAGPGTIYADDIKFSTTTSNFPKWKESYTYDKPSTAESQTTQVESEVQPQEKYDAFVFPYNSDFFNRKGDWESSGGIMQVTGGKMRIETSSSTNYSIFVLKGGKFWVNYEYTIFIDWAKGDSVNLISRYSPDSGSYFSCSFFDDGANVTLYEFRGDTSIELDRAPNFVTKRKYDWTETRSLGIRTQGGEISCLSNGQVKVQAKAKYPMPISGNAAIEMWSPQNGESTVIVNQVIVKEL
jgi:hypothetical protein